MPFLSEGESASLRLARMSLHIVGGDEDTFEPQAELPAEHDDFLLQILRDVAADGVYSFVEGSTTRATVEAMATRLQTFEVGAQILARDFCRLHKGAARDGAFFVFELGVTDPTIQIYALIKYDYSQALEIVHREGSAALRRIVEAFVDKRSSIQKSAIIRTRNGTAESLVSTRDRTGKPSPTLTDYFRDYLQVSRQRSDHQLTSEAKEAVREAISDNREYLPKGGVAAAVSHAYDVLRNASEINEGVVRNAVWVGAGQPEDDETRARFEAAIDRALKKKKLSGLTFVPARDALPRTVKRTIMTAEGVRLEYNTALEGGAVNVEKLGGGKTKFSVVTERYTDAVGTDKTGRDTRRVE